MNNFIARRRQQFITEDFYAATQSFYEKLFAGLHAELNAPDLTVEGLSLLWQSIAGDGFERLVLHYTAGEPIQPLRVELEKVIGAHERWRAAKQQHEKDDSEPALYFAEIAHYERCIQLISLCYLLHRRDLLPRIAAMQDAIYSGTDTLYEDLLAYELENRYDVDVWYHDKPYRDIINSLYRDTDEESLADLKAYCLAWYPALKKAPWHDSHLRMTDTDGDYFGYWAFEAGAVAYLLELDDSSIDHMVYPRDLVAWARENKHLSEEPEAGQTARLRCEGGQPCPREGWWFTPAKVGSRHHFQHGEVMPIFSTDYGTTIWQWDARQ